MDREIRSRFDAIEREPGPEGLGCHDEVRSAGCWPSLPGLFSHLTAGEGEPLDGGYGSAQAEWSSAPLPRQWEGRTARVIADNC